MEDWSKFVKDIERQASVVSVGRPVILKDTRPPLVLLSLPEYKHYRWLMSQQGYISAADARRAAHRAFLQDLVGCPVGDSSPEWVEEPAPHWEVPFHYKDGTWVTTIEVDARTGETGLSETRRNELLEQLEKLILSKQKGA